MGTLSRIVIHTLQLDMTVIRLLHVELRALVITAVYQAIPRLPLVFTLVHLLPYVGSKPGLFDGKYRHE